jgi:translation initiation factor IF-2
MAKVRVSDLAKKMGIAQQDLVFKLRSIGVRLEGEDETIDTEIISAILSGKKLQHQPREVILRDEAATKTAPVVRRTPTRRVPTNPLRPPRRRTIIQKVEPHIRTLPARQRTAAEVGGPAMARTAEAVIDPALPGTAAPGEEVVHAPMKPEMVEAVAVAGEPAAARIARPPREVTAKPKRPTTLREAVIDDDEAGGSARRRRRKERHDEGEATSAHPSGPVMVSEGMTVREFAEKLGVLAKDLISRLMKRGVMATINHVLDIKTATELAAELGVEIMQVSFEEEVQLQEELKQPDRKAHLQPRAPVVTVMGHVDHGKTSLLDRIRSSRVAASESGGITQHIGAYHATINGRSIVFLDTPGHEAFTKLRARGAKVTDIVVLVVAADDGVMAQTVEAINHAKAGDVSVVVAINKIDKPNANIERVKRDLANQGIMLEEWGGDIPAAQVSALKGTGIDELLELILLTADLLELKADPDIAAQGVVLEARKDPGRGSVATVLVQDGTLRVGDVFVSGSTWGKVRSMSDERGLRVTAGGPATPVEVTGFGELPNAGDNIQVVDSEQRARSIAEFRQQEERRRELAPTHGSLSLDQLFGRIQEGDIQDLPLVVKADVQGSLEVLRDTLTGLSTGKVRVNVVHSGVGGITTNDVSLAAASKAIIVGFNVRPERTAADLAAKEGVEIRSHNVIYELTDELLKAMTGLLKPTVREVSRGRAEVRETFKIPKIGTIAGCHVVEGIIPRAAKVRLLRDNVVVYEGRIGSLRRFKDDASEVRSGFDCGIGLERFQDVKPGDFIEAYDREEVAATL